MLRHSGFVGNEGPGEHCEKLRLRHADRRLGHVAMPGERFSVPSLIHGEDVKDLVG
jgi:hypothetical protein